MVLLFGKIKAPNGKYDSAVPKNSKYDFSHEHKVIESKMQNSKYAETSTPLVQPYSCQI